MIFRENTELLPIDEEIILRISYNKKMKQVTYTIQMDEFSHSMVEEVINPKFYGYKLGIFIGGNNPTPKPIEILMRRKADK